MINTRLDIPSIRWGLAHIRRLDVNDAQDLTQAINDPEVRRWLPIPSTYDETVARTWCAETSESIRTSGAGLVLAIDAGTGIVGSIDVKRIDWRARSAEISYWLTESARGSGLATQSLVELSTWMLDEMSFERCELRIAEANSASLRVAARAGFTREGTARRAGFLPNGDVIDLSIWSRVRGDPSE